MQIGRSHRRDISDLLSKRGKVPTLRRIGLARALSKLGYCSRSQAGVLIREKRVFLNGRVVRDPESPVRFPQDRIEIDGSPIKQASFIYLAMNKPRGVVATASDEKQRDTIYSLLPDGLPWMGPVGRLDKASEGLLLLSNDSEWAAEISSPSNHLEKMYHVQVNCVAGDSLIAKIALDRDPKKINSKRPDDLRAKSARLIRHGGTNSWLEITLDEGKNRQIRRLLETVGVEVLRLIRVSVGPLQLGDLTKGATRHLTPEEKRDIDRAIGR